MKSLNNFVQKTFQKANQTPFILTFNSLKCIEIEIVLKVHFKEAQLRNNDLKWLSVCNLP
jgi:hypothetical protein